jgi:phosphate transport system substrate-binding protein
MKRTGLLLLAALLLPGCGGDTIGKRADSSANESRIITIDGSSTVFPVSEAAAEEFQKLNPRVKVTVGTSGTGGGFKKFVRGETDISDASRPILREEIDLAREHGIEYIELPICFDALTVVINKDNDWVDYMSTAELRKMWDKDSKGKVTKWSDIRKGWPDEKFILFGPGTDSGTFDYFTEAINGKSRRSRDDYTASEDDNVLVQGVIGNKYGLGYFGYAYYAGHKDKLRCVPILDEHGKAKKPVEPGAEAIRAGTYTPLSRPLFLYASKKSVEERPEVREFVEFYLKNAAALSRRKKYVPLPPKAYGMCQERFAKRQTGTGFGGKQEVGLPIEAILQREPK